MQGFQPYSSRSQRGASALSIIVILGMAAVILTIAFKLYPAFYENWQIELVVDSFEDERGLDELSVNDIERNFQKRLTTNNVRDFKMKDNVEITMEDDTLYIDVDYEVRIPMYSNVDAIVSFQKSLEKRY